MSIHMCRGGVMVRMTVLLLMQLSKMSQDSCTMNQDSCTIGFPNKGKGKFTV